MTDIVKKTVATGSVVPRKEMEIKPRVSGIIEKLFVEAGDPVKAGDMIAKIRLMPDMVTLANAQTRVAKARIDLDGGAERAAARYQPTARAAAHLQGRVRQASSSTSTARSRSCGRPTSNLPAVEKSERGPRGPARPKVVASTMDGTVLEVPVKVGNSVIEANNFNDGTTIATVADMGDMIFQGKVDESEVGKMRRSACSC